MKEIAYYRRLYNRFGFRALWFLFYSKFRFNRAENIHIRGIRFPVSLSNFNVDVTTLFQIFFAKEYNVQLKEAPEFIIDCGANIGLSAVYFANKYPKARIVAIEPESKNFEYLKKNTKNYPNIICLQKAVWPRATRLEVFDTGHGGWAFQTRESESAGDVEGVTIGELMSEYSMEKIDLLKIDIEGAEKELFASGYEDWLVKTQCIAIELHDFLEPGISDVFYKAILPFSFKTFSMGENLVCIK